MNALTHAGFRGKAACRVDEHFDPVTPGAVWSSPLPAPVIRPGPEAAGLPGRTGVFGAQLPHLLLSPLQWVGRLFHGWTLTSTSNHQVPAEQRAFGQQLWPHNTCFQQRQSATSESSLHSELVSLQLRSPEHTQGFVSLLISARMCVNMQGTTVESICYELRYLPDTRSLAKDHALLLLCDLSHSNQDAVEVAIVSEWSESASIRICTWSFSWLKVQPRFLKVNGSDACNSKWEEPQCKTFFFFWESGCVIERLLNSTTVSEVISSSCTAAGSFTWLGPKQLLLPSGQRTVNPSNAYTTF